MFMDLQSLISQIEDLESSPPFDQWHPQHCGSIDIEIHANGQWYHNGSPIGRLGLVKLFAKVLVKEEDQYFLKTPAEKMQIQVHDAPFVITQWQRHDSQQGQILELCTNIEQKVVLSEQHSMLIKDDHLYVHIHRGLLAKVHRNVYYQLIDIAKEETIDGHPHLVINSAGERFSIGRLEQ